MKGILPLHAISQKSTSTAYHLILNCSISSAHPARGDPVSAWSTAFIAIHSPHTPSSKIVCSPRLCHTQGRQPGRNPGAYCARSCFVFHVKYGWRMMLKEWLKKPYVASSEGWTLLSCQRISIWHELDAMLVSRRPLFHKALGGWGS